VLCRATYLYVIDPNDGVIQAAILRCATPSELNYSHDPSHSLKMKNILYFILDNHQGIDGEAAREFIFALLSKKMRLNNEHLQDIYDKYKNIDDPFIISSFELIEKTLID
jgi:hypothetical protein